MTPRIAAVLGALAAGALAVLISPPAPASAHAVLSSSNPIQGAILASAPTEVVLTFTESVRQVPGKTIVIGPDGERVDKGEPTFAGAVVTIPVDQSAGNGTYLVSYRVISADSHPVAGGYTYSVGAPSTPPSLEQSDDTNPVVATAIKVAKYIGYAGLVLVVGPVLVLSLLWPARLSRRRVAAVVWTGMGLVGFATVAAVWLQAPYTAGGGIFDVSGGQIRDVLATTFGTAHLVRLGLLVAIALLLRPLLRGPNESGKADQILLLVLGGAALMTWPIAGHPAASPVAAVSVVVDAVHLASMAVWLGGLVMLVGFLLRQANERELGAVLPVWSRWAALAVSALVLAGTVQALIEVSTPDALVSTTYGRLILTKVGLLAVVIAVAAYSRRLVQRRAAEGEPRQLRRVVWVELAITAVVLGMSAVLVQTTPARTAAANEALGGTADYYSKTISSNLYNLQVDIDPAAVGNNSIHLYAYDLSRNPLKVVEWKATAALPANDVAPIEIPLLPLTDNHATGELTFSLAGDWQLRFTVRISDIDQATVTATVPVS